MKREELKELGLTDDQATAVINAYSEALKNYVPKARLDEVITDRNNLKDQVTERDKQIDTLKGSAGDNQALKDQIAQLQAKNNEAAKAYKAQLEQIKLDNAVNMALTGAKAKNAKAVRALLDLEKAKVGDDGKVDGLEAQIAALQKSDGYLFDAATPAPAPQPKLTGITPKDGAGGNPQPKAVKDMSYTELCEFMAQGGKVE